MLNGNVSLRVGVIEYLKRLICPMILFLRRKYEEAYKEGVQEVSSIRKDHEMRVGENRLILACVCLTLRFTDSKCKVAHSTVVYNWLCV